MDRYFENKFGANPRAANPNDVYCIVHKPKAIEIYTKRMGGVIELITRWLYTRLYIEQQNGGKKVFFHVLETAVVNASIICKKFYNFQCFDSNKFQVNLVEQLTAGYDKDEYRGGPKH